MKLIKLELDGDELKEIRDALTSDIATHREAIAICPNQDVKATLELWIRHKRSTLDYIERALFNTPNNQVAQRS
jgi:hypothetical protein